MTAVDWVDLAAVLAFVGMAGWVVYTGVLARSNRPQPAPLPRRDPGAHASIAEAADDMAVLSPAALADQFRREHARLSH